MSRTNEGSVKPQLRTLLDPALHEQKSSISVVSSTRTITSSAVSLYLRVFHPGRLSTSPSHHTPSNFSRCCSRLVHVAAFARLGFALRDFFARGSGMAINP